jgi:hypothetical protein
MFLAPFVLYCKNFDLLIITVQQAMLCSAYLQLCGAKQLFLFGKSHTVKVSFAEMILWRAASPEF